MKKTVLLLLCISLIVPLFSIFGSASGNATHVEEDEEMTAELQMAYGGANGIVSMTFDDGIYDTAVWLNEMFEKYDLRGSCMMCMNSVTDEMVPKWNELFADGYLEPESHSYSHLIMPAPSWGEKYESFKQNNTPQNYAIQIDSNKDLIHRKFGHYALGFAPSNNTLSAEGTEHLMKIHYAMRKGQRWGSAGFQSLDPTPGSDEAGGWYNLFMMGFKGNEQGSLISGLDHIATEGGWYITMCHGIYEEEGGDSTFAKAEPVFQYMGKLQNEGKIWVTTFGDAIRYVRERQNTTVSYKEEGGVYKLTLTMAQKTADGLPLDPYVFDHPLTVKVRVPDGYAGAYYYADGGAKFAPSFEEDGKSYAYVNARPTAEEISVSFVTTEGATLAPVRRGTIDKDGQFTANLGSIGSASRSRIFVSFAGEAGKIYANANLSLQFGGTVPKEIRIWSVNASAMSDEELYKALSAETVSADLIGSEPIHVIEPSEKTAVIDVTDVLNASGGRGTFLIDTDTLPSLSIPLTGASIEGAVLHEEIYYSPKKLDFHHSLSIEDELIYNVYFTPTEEIASFTLGNVSYTNEELAALPTKEIGGKAYRHLAVPVALQDAATPLSLCVRIQTEAGDTATIEPKLSVLAYLDALLAKETDEDVRVMLLDLMLLIRSSVQFHAVGSDVSAVASALKKYDYSPLLTSKLVGAVAKVPASVEKIGLRLDGVPSFLVTPKDGMTYTFHKPNGDRIEHTTETVDGVTVYVLPIRTFHLFLPITVNAKGAEGSTSEDFTLANYFAALTGKEREVVKYAAAFAVSFDTVRSKK